MREMMMKKLEVFKLSVMCLFLMKGCGIEVGNPHVPSDPKKSGTINVTVGQDYDEEYESLELAFTSVEFVDEAGNAEEIENPNPDQTIPLSSDATASLALFDSGSTATESGLLSNQQLSTGNYTKIRLKINSSAQNLAFQNGKSYPVDLQNNNVIEMDYQMTVNEEGVQEVFIQPSLSESLELKGDRVLFTPRFFAADRKKLTTLSGSLKGSGLNGRICVSYNKDGAIPVLSKLKERFQGLNLARGPRSGDGPLSDRGRILEPGGRTETSKSCGIISIKASVKNSKFNFVFKLPPGEINLRFVDDQNQVFDINQTITLEEGKPSNVENLEMTLVE